MGRHLRRRQDCHHGAADPLRLSDLGYPQPQPPTLLQCDNEVAVGIANKAVKAKLSKACDMRLHWLIDRVSQSQGQFIVKHLRGLWNIADFFTKTLPLARHRFFAPFVAVDAPDSPLPRLNMDLPTSYSQMIFLRMYLQISCGCVDPKLIVSSISTIYIYILYNDSYCNTSR